MDKVASFGLTTYWDLQKGEARNEMQKDLELYTNVSDLIIDSFATYVSNCWCKMNLDISKKTTF